MSKITTTRLAADAAGLDAAAAHLAGGALVAFPTETVYGLGADATNGHAVAAVYEAKGRPSFNPLIVHVPDLAAAEALASFGPEARRLAEAFWPGPLTLVLPARAGNRISPLVTAGLDTIALRCPDLPLARDLLARCGRPVAAPSANPSGYVSPTTADHVLQGLSGRIAAVVDGGPCPVGVESTIVDCSGAPRLLRPGGLPGEEIEACLGHELLPPETTPLPTSPGQLASHYAPGQPVRLNADAARPDELLLGFGPVACSLNLSETGDLREAAANLFGHLRALDARGLPIAVSPIPDHGLGRAINDRLSRAAAPRPQA